MSKVQVVSFLLPTSTGTFDITIAGFGTPTAAIFELSVDASDNTLRTIYRNSYGFTDGTNQSVHAISSDDNATPSRTARAQRSDAVLLEISGSQVEQARANFDSWITDGVRINVTDISGARICKVTLFTDVDAKVGFSPALTTGSTTINVGLAADLVYTSSVGLASGAALTSNVMLTTGITHNGASVVNTSQMVADVDNVNPTESNRNDSALYSIGAISAGAISWQGSIGTFTSTGFDVTVDSGNAGSQVFSYLALDFPVGTDIDLKIIDTPTSTGTITLGSTSFTPTFCSINTSVMTAIDAGINTNLIRTGFSACASGQHSMGIFSVTNQAPSVTGGLSSSGKLTVVFNNALFMQANFVGFTSSGVSLNFTTVNGSVRKAAALFIGDASSGSVTIIPTSIASAESFGTPTITTGVVLILPVAIPTQESVGSPTIVTELVISPVTIPSEESVGDPVIELILQQIFPDGIPTEEFVGRPTVLGGDDIIIPVLSRQTWNAVAQYLRDLVFRGQDNDVIMAWFRSEGLEDGAYNDLWYEYLLQKGFIDGSLTDKYAAWRQGDESSNPWLLSSGSWNDNKIWRDTETWKDS